MNKNNLLTRLDDSTLTAVDLELSDEYESLQLPENSSLKKLFITLDKVAALSLDLSAATGITELSISRKRVIDFTRPLAIEPLRLPENLKVLELKGVQGCELPESLRSHQRVEQLRLINCAIEKLGDLSAMTALASLTVRNEELGRFHNYEGGNEVKLIQLEQLLTASALEKVTLDVTQPLMEQWDLLMRLPKRIELDFRFLDHVARTEQLNKQRDILLQAPLTDGQRQVYWQVLVQAVKPRVLPEMDGRFHLTFLEAKYTPFKKHALAWLRSVAEHSVSQRPLDSESVLYVCGKSGIKATELKAKAQEIGFTLNKQLDENVTHILLGANPKQTEMLDPEQHLLIDDTALSQWFEQAAPQFLQHEAAIDSGMIDSLLEMLRSPDETAHKVAVEMLAQGGVTEAMWMPLFLILKSTSDKALRSDIQQLLVGKGDEPFQLAVADRTFFDDALRGVDHRSRPLGEGPMFKRFKGVTKRWGRALSIAFSKAYFDRFGVGLIWLLIQKQECEQRSAIIRQLVEGECLNWHKGCGFASMLEGGDEAWVTKCHHIPTYLTHNDDLGVPKTCLPEALPEQMRITELDLHNCYLANLPANFERYQQVKKLNLHFNHLKKLPPKLTELSELEELDLSYNHLQEFPKVLFKMKNLKKLDLRQANAPLRQWKYKPGESYEPIRAPQTFRDAFPDCEILED